MAQIRNGKIIFNNELLKEQRAVRSQKTGECEQACMLAIEDRCLCYCKGANHGLKVQGRLYEGESIRDLHDFARYEEAA